MKCVYTRLLSEEELRPHLERRDGIAFKGLSGEWEGIERQVLICEAQTDNKEIQAAVGRAVRGTWLNICITIYDSSYVAECKTAPL
jgi:hypothetical protein